VARTELYVADEVFLVGTGCQVAWVRAVDKRTIGTGERGPITARIQSAYEEAVYGRSARYASWLTGV
jgi:branched-chain amino acid aminotransferase